MTSSWQDKVTGIQCPMDYPRTDHEEFKYPVKKLSTSTLYLNINQAFRGYCILIYDGKHVTRIDQLSDAEWSVLAKDIHIAEIAVYKAMHPDHVNIASLGMVVPHLHWHIIPRYQGDPRWGGPIWTSDLKDMSVEKLQDEEYRQLADRISQVLDRLR